jgi:putative ABC transport system ATP-binding protein
MVNLTVEAGDFAAIVGASGSGKTTLLNLIGALDAPTEGKVFFEGEDLTWDSPARLAEIRLRKIGFIFQAFNLIPVLTAYENVEYVMLLQGVPARERKKKALEALIEVGLKDCVNRRPLDLSSGQQQRVAVARAIAAEPKIVLADEPTANLDSKTGAALMELLLYLNQSKGITFLFSTHDPMIKKHAKMVINLKDGRIV